MTGSRSALPEATSRLPQLCAVTAGGIALLALAGWQLNARFLAGQWATYVPMAPSTALLFLLLSAALFCQARWPAPRWSRLFALATVSLIGLVGLLVLAQFVAGFDLGVEQALARTTEWLGSAPLGRMSPLTAITFLLESTVLIVLLLAPHRRYAPTVAALCAISAAAISLVFLVGYVYGAPLLYGSLIIPVALPTAIAFLLTALGQISLAAPHVPALQTWNEASLRGRLVRAFLPPLLVSLFVVGWLRNVVIQPNLPLNPAVEAALEVLAVGILILAIILWVARRVADEVEEARGQVRESEAQHQLVLESVDEIVYRIAITTDPFQGMVKFVSHRVEDILGYKPEEFYADPGLWASLLHPDDVLAVAAQTEAIYANAKPGTREFRLRHKISGKYYWMEDRVVPQLDDGGSLIGIFGVARDITERKQVEEALRQSESSFKDAQVIAGLGSYVLDLSAGMWKSSVILDKIFGIDETYVHSVESWAELVHPDERQKMIGYLTNEVIGKRVRFDKDYRIIRKNDQAERWVHGIGELEVDAQNQPLKMHGTITDITERKAAEAALARSRDMLFLTGRLAGVGGWELDLDTQTLSWTEGVYRIHEVDPATRPNLAWAINFYAPEARPVISAAVQAGIDSGTPWDLELPLITAQGRQIWVRAQGAAERRDGRTIRLNGAFQDITERKAAEIKLRLQATALDAAANAVVITDRSGVIEWVNPAFTRLTGYAAAEALGQNPRLLQSGQHDPAFYQSLWATILSGQVWRGEMINRRKDGGLYTEEQSITPVLDESGAIAHFVAIKNDITDRKQAAAAAKLFRALIDQSNDAIEVVDPETGRYLDANEKAWQDLGYSREEFLALSVFDVDLNFDQASFRRAGQDLRKSGSLIIDSRHRRKDGSAFPVEVNVKYVELEQGYVVAVARDITERKQAEAARIESSAQFRTLFEVSPDAIMLIDPVGDWPILDCNTAAGQMNGYTRAELIGQSVDLLNLTSGSQAERVEYLRLLRQSPVTYVETYHRRKDGTVLSIEVSTSLIMLGGREVVLGIDRDVTQRKQREREVEAVAAVTTALRGAATQAQMLPIIVDQLSALLNASSAALSLRDLQTDELVVMQGMGELAGLEGKRLAPGQGLGGHVVTTGKPYVTANVLIDPYYKPVNPTLSDQAVACVPLLTSQQVLGVLWAGRVAPFSVLEVRVLSAIADIAASAIQRAGLHEQMEAQLRRLAALRQIDHAIMNSFDLHTTLVILLRHVAEQLVVDACDILVLTRGINTLEYAAGRGFRTAAIEHTRGQLGEGYAGRAALERRLISVPDLRADPTLHRRAAMLADEGFVTLFCVPLTAKGQVVGVLEIWHRSPLNPDSDWLAYLETLAGQAAIAVADARLFGDLQRSNADMRLAYDSTLEGWSAALDLRDKETEGHSQRVTALTLQLARELGVTRAELEHIRRGALLHDIGKMGIPDAILFKPGKLTDEEWVSMRRHPKLAYDLLARIAFLRPALDIPYCHHEWWDGTGYPRQLKGNVIPLAARIFAVVDVWDALRSDRTYRASWPEEQVRAYLLEQSGKQFDPQVVQAFLALQPPL